MPRRLRLRIALIWLLTMVIPVYGMASATMLLCSPAGHIAPPASASHDNHASMHGEHAQADQRAHHGSDQTAADDTAAMPHHAGQKCSACASCCSGVALPGVTLALTGPDPASAEFPPLLASVLDLVMPGPERPPRAFPA
jgi:hypothetical protein